MKILGLIQKYIRGAAVLLILGASAGANAATVFTLFLTAEGGDYDGQTLYSIGPNSTLLNGSTIEFDHSGVTWDLDGNGGSTGSYIATAIDINYFGTHYTADDSIGGDILIHFDNGRMVGIDYTTQGFTLAMLPTNHTGFWEGSVVVTPVPLPGALLLFTLALGTLGLKRFGKSD